MSGSVLLEHGPITMTLDAMRAGRPCPEAASEGAKAVLRAFGKLTGRAEYMATARMYARRVRGGAAASYQEYPEILRRMIAAVAALDEADFTPLAAVAGTLSDVAVCAMAACGADYAIANNGGDIAFRLPEEKKFLKVGLICDLAARTVSHRLWIPRSGGIGGIATSGLGGRSFTRGVASAVTALGASAGEADAAATSIANACDCDDPCVERCTAGEIDPSSDIAALVVTKSVGRLRRESARAALAAGARRAEELCAKGLIKGAILFVAGEMALRWQGEEPPFAIEPVG